MKKATNRNTTDISFSRQKAEKLLKEKQAKISKTSSETDIQKLNHELASHQIELKLQNEELKLAKSIAQEAAEKYSYLYDFAPSGYFSLSKEGKIIDLNLSAAEMIGKERSNLKNRQFAHFVSDDTKPTFKLFLEKVLTRETKE